MQETAVDREVVADIEPVLNGMGYELVDAKKKKSPNSDFISIVIYSAAGIGSRDCTLVYKTIYPRLELIGEEREIHLEVSSPGVNRRLKSHREFAVFKGKGVRVLLDGSNSWLSGVIVSAGSSSVCIETDTGSRELDYSEIRRAKLEYLQEGK